MASQVYASFNAKFWSSELGYCYDIVDKEGGGNDASLRPNQLLSYFVIPPSSCRRQVAGRAWRREGPTRYAIRSAHPCAFRSQL